MRLSYAICTHNEVDSLLYLLNEIESNKDEEDEVVIIDDYSTNEETIEILKSQASVHYNNLNKDYATHKNKLIEKCSGDYIFQLDADEYPTRTLFKNIKNILKKNPKVELFRVPRENFVTDIQPYHFKKWNWTMDAQSRINYPDYQTRIFKNKKSIHWTRPVHEYIVGHTSASNLPKDRSLDLIHTKSISKQEANNTRYSTNYNSDGSVK